MPPKAAAGGKSRKAELERLAEEARLARLAEQQRMMEERQKALAENEKKSKMEQEWVEQQNTAYLVEEEEHVKGLSDVVISVDMCEEFISKTEEWKRFIGCSRLPDPTSEKDVNSYITLLRDQEFDSDLTAAMTVWHSIQQVAEEMDGILSASRIAGDAEKEEAYTVMMKALQDIGWCKLNFATSWAMQNPMGFINPQNIAKVECRVDNIKIGLFINVTKALRSRTLDFPECGFSVDLPRSLVTGDIGIRFVYTPQDPLSACHPNGELMAMGGVLHVHILGMPSAPTVTNKGWMLRKAISGNDPMGLELLTYPLAHEGVAGRDVPPIKISYTVPPEIFLDVTQARVARWNPDLNIWDEENITETSLDASSRTVSFKTSFIGTDSAFALVIHRASAFPYRKWSLFPADENLAYLVIEAQSHTLQFEIGSGLMKLLQPQCPELHNLIGIPLRPGTLLVALRKRGINIMPSALDTETVRAVGVVAKATEVNTRACFNAASISAGFAVHSSHWNAGMSSNDCMFRVRESEPASEHPPDDDKWLSVVYRSNPLGSWSLSKRTEKDEIFQEESLVDTRTALLVTNLLAPDASPVTAQRLNTGSGVHRDTVRRVLELVGVFSYTATASKPGALSIPELLTVARISQLDGNTVQEYLGGNEIEITHMHGERFLQLMEALNIAGGRTFQRSNTAGPPHTRLGLWPSVKIFLASSKADFENERDYLHRYVLPALKYKCLSRQIHFSVVDLLWGVEREEEVYQKLGLARVFNLIDSCSLPASTGKLQRPFFLAFLGERGGWAPPRDGPERATATSAHQAFAWISKSQHADESMLALMLHHAVLRRTEFGTEPLVCLRDPAVFAEPRYRAEVPPHVRAKFADDKPRSDSPEVAIGRLKAALRQKILTRCFDGYPATYHSYDPDTQPPAAASVPPSSDPSAPSTEGADGAASATTITPAVHAAAAALSADPLDAMAVKSGFVKLSGLDQLGSRVFRQLWEAIDSAYPAVRVLPELVPAFRAQQELLTEHYAKHFQGQEETMTKLREVVHGTSARSPIVVLMGPSGSGRTSVLARLCQSLRTDDSVKVIPCFKNKSVSFFTMIEYIALELESNKEVEDGDDAAAAEAAGKRGGKGGKVKEGALQDASGRLLIGTDMLLESLRRNCGKKRGTQIVLVLDGLEKNELSQVSYCAGRDQFLESKFRCVVSASEGVSDHNKDSIISMVEGLNDKDCHRIASVLLAVNDRRLDPADLDVILQKEHAGSPFYLKLAADEISSLPPSEIMRERLEGLPETVEGMYLKIIIPKLEREHGLSVVKNLLSWLSVTTWGLHDVDALQLLQQTNASLVSLCDFYLLCDALRPFLEFSGGGSADTLCIGHTQMREAVVKKYLSDDRELVRTYQVVATFLMTQADPSKKNMWDRPAARAFRALPELFCGGKMWLEVQNSLCSLRFLEGYIRACGIPPLMTEYLSALKVTEMGHVITNQKVKRYQEFIEGHTLLLHADPGCIYQMAMSATEMDIRTDLGNVQQDVMNLVEQILDRNEFETSSEISKAISLGQLFSAFADAADRGILRSLATDKVDLVANAAAKTSTLREQLWAANDPQVGMPTAPIPIDPDLAAATAIAPPTPAPSVSGKEKKDKKEDKKEEKKEEVKEEDPWLKQLQIQDLHKISMFQDQPTPGLRLVMQALSILLNIIPPIPAPPAPREPLASMETAHATLTPLTKAEITEFRNFPAPRPPCVTQIAKGFCLIMGLPPIVKKNIEDWWTPCKKFLAAADAMKRLAEMADTYTNGNETPSEQLWTYLTEFMESGETSVIEMRNTKSVCVLTFGTWIRSIFNWFSTPPVGSMVVFRARRIVEVATFDHWRAANKLFQTWTSTERLTKLDKRAVSLDVLRALEPVVNNYLFDPVEISKVSKAAAILCLWVKDIVDSYLDPKFIESLAASLEAAKQLEQPPVEAPKAAAVKGGKRK